MAETSRSVIERGRVIVARVAESEQLYWYRAHQRAVRRVYRCASAVRRASAAHQDDYLPGLELRIAHSRLAYCSHQLDRVMGWDRMRIGRVR